MAQCGITTYSAAEIRKVRKAITSCIEIGAEDLPDGWSRSPFPVDWVMSAVRSLKLREGWTLRGYVFRSGSNGNGVVWAVPTTDGFPEPDACPKLEDYFLAPPKPPTAEDPKAVLEGDGSSRSYLEAALLSQELYEFAALWHGTSWGACEVLDGPPEGWDSWERTEHTVNDWEPRVVTHTDSNVTVELAVSDPVGRLAVSLYRYTFPPSGYAFTLRHLELGYGGVGIIF